jgi:hypothetical protein
MAWDNDYFYSLRITSDNKYKIRFNNTTGDSLPYDWGIKPDGLPIDDNYSIEDGEWDLYPELQMVGGGRYKETLICVNDKGNIYYGDI